MTGIADQRLAQGIASLVQSLSAQDHAQVAPIIRLPGDQAHDLAEAGGGGIEPPFLGVHQPEQVLGGRAFRIPPQQPLADLAGLVVGVLQVEPTGAVHRGGWASGGFGFHGRTPGAPLDREMAARGKDATVRPAADDASVFPFQIRTGDHRGSVP